MTFQSPGFAIAVAGMFFYTAASLPGCSRQGSAVAQVAPNVGAAAPAQANPALLKPHTACWLLPAAAVSKVLGESLTASADLGAIKYGNTSCHYYAPGSDPDEDAPRLTLTLDWNGYNLMAIDIPKAGPATAASPYADIGDGALLDHGVLFVRAGEHSVAMDLRGQGDLHAIARQLITAAKPKLSP